MKGTSVRFPEMRTEFEINLRPNTMDKWIFEHIVLENEYHISSFHGYHVVDIGAHIGCFGVLSLENGCSSYRGFEPWPSNFKILGDNVKRYVNAQIFDFGIGSDYREIEIRGSDEVSPWGEKTGGKTVVSEMWNYGKNSEKYQVHIRPLDTVTAQIPPPIMLKIDCEGSEYEILYNSDLSKMDIIVGEWHDLDNEQRNGPSLMKFLQESGYNVKTQKGDWPVLGIFHAHR